MKWLLFLVLGIAAVGAGIAIRMWDGDLTLRKKAVVLCRPQILRAKGWLIVKIQSIAAGSSIYLMAALSN